MNTNCEMCGRQKVRIVKYTEDGEKTYNTAWVCINKNCSKYNDINKLKDWKIIYEEENTQADTLQSLQRESSKIE